MRTSFLEWQNKYIVLILYSAAEGGYACDCYLSWKINMNLKTSFILETVLWILAYAINKYYCLFSYLKIRKFHLLGGGGVHPSTPPPHFRGPCMRVRVWERVDARMIGWDWSNKRWDTCTTPFNAAACSQPASSTFSSAVSLTRHPSTLPPYSHPLFTLIHPTILTKNNNWEQKKFFTRGTISQGHFVWRTFFKGQNAGNIFYQGQKSGTFRQGHCRLIPFI
jgi:hypothetical protein